MQPILPVIPNIELPVTTYGDKQKDYIPLYCYKDGEGVVTIRWKLSWKERFQIFFQGYFFHQIMTFNKALFPVQMVSNITLDPPVKK